MTVEFDDLVEAVITIGNHKRTIEICEPNVMQSLKLEEWMVRRTLITWGLIFREMKKDKGEMP